MISKKCPNGSGSTVNKIIIIIQKGKKNGIKV
jgi:hypothetical protein